MSSFKAARSAIRFGADPVNAQRALFMIAATLILGLTACFGLSDADKRYGRGVDLLEEGRFDEAIAEFNQAIVLDASMAAAFHNRALAHERTGKLASAIKDYTRSIELDPDLALAYANRGSAYLEVEDLQSALSDLNRSLGLDEKSVSAHTLLGLVLLDLGRAEEALANLDRAIELDPEFYPAYGNRGIAHSRTGKIQLALADYGRAIEINPSYVLAYSNRGSCELWFHVADDTGNGSDPQVHKIKSTNLRITPAPAFLSELRDLMGEKNVWISK